MKRSQKKLLIIIGVLTALILVSIGGIKATSTAGFCTNCHFMNPAVDTWYASSHKSVNCLSCHADDSITGIVKAKVNGLKEVALTVSGNVPAQLKSEVNNQRCLPCHEKPESKKESQLNFNHQFHLTTGASCTTCHARVVHTRPEEKKLDKKVCLECHQKTKGPVDDCASCHKVVPKPKDHDIQWMLNHKKSVASNGLESCTSCHKDDYCSKCHQ